MATAAPAPKAVLLRGDDNVAVAARPIPQGHLLDLGGRSVEVREPIGLGHKVALGEIAQGDPVRKYGQIIGFASRPIAAGSPRPRPQPQGRPLRARLRLRHRAAAACRRSTAPGRFQGYLRPDGRVGTRNYIAVISTVNCSASTSRYIADHFRDGRWRAEFPNVDGVFAITHKGGCGLPFEGPDHQILERVLAGFARHPNVAAYVIVGLGCEGAYAQHLVETQHLTLARFPATELAGISHLQPLAVPGC